MSRQKDRVFRLIFLSFFIFNLFLFCYICSRPLAWSNKEVLGHGFFWSMDGLEDLSLRAGLRQNDFIKVFSSTFVDGIFRPRQCSYLVEMLSFKFWQYFSRVCTRNHTVLLLHVGNALLIGGIVYTLTQDPWLAGLGAVGFLNAGAALATLQYPFRNAKILVMFFFLLAVRILLNKRAEDVVLPWKKVWTLGLLVLLCVFSDETALFLWPFLLVCLVYRYGLRVITHKKVLWGTGLTLVGAAVLFALFFQFSKTVCGTELRLAPQRQYLAQLLLYWQNPQTYTDILNGFIFYFLRRNYGHWEKSFLGLTALGSFLFLLTVLWHGRKAKTAPLFFACAFLFVVKILCLPHDSGYHRTFMPPGTVFPTLLFFSYYYVYCESVLLALMFAFLLHKKHRDNHYYFSALCLAVSVISFSNVLQVKDGPKDALAFMNYRSSYRQQMVKDVLAVGRVLDQNKDKKVFLSFPQPARGLVDGRLHQDDLNLYVRLLPIRYLRQIASGQATVPLENVSPQGFGRHQELDGVDCLYDVPEKDLIDLTDIRAAVDAAQWQPLVNGRSLLMTRSKRMKGLGVAQVVFFIKGRGEFLVQAPGFKQSGVQTYGQSYQLFCFRDIAPAPAGSRNVLSVHFIPTVDDHVALVGPFIFYEDQTIE